MRKLFIATVIIFLTSFLTISNAQVPFSKGVNLTNWFQSGSARQVQFAKFTKQDFINIKSLGCDVIRLPINLNFMTNGAPSYTIDPLFYTFLDSAVNWAESLNIYLLLDNHTFDPNVNTESSIGTVLRKVWGQMASHYKNRSNYILYEVLNEPHGLTNQVWGQIQQTVIDTIRTIDTRHTIVVGGSDYNSYNDLGSLPYYTDANLLYTFHFYDPFMFTHQGATWVNPSMEPLAGVPFPYNATTMPPCPASLKGSWVESSLNNYSNDGTVAKVKSLLDIAANFKTSRGVNVFCGELGVYIPNSNNNDRVLWYDTVRRYMEKKGIPWTMWDYKGGFGLFKKGSNEMFDYDLNVPLLQALNFNVPPQKVYVARPDSVGFPIYTDLIASGINESSSASTGTIDYYSTTIPNNGKFCIYINGIAQYNQLGFDFVPDKDLSQLKTNNYAIDFMVRGDSPGASFDIRFLDKKTNLPDGHPWRMGITITDSYGPWDKKWHHVRIPLSSLTEKGAWDVDTWYNPMGKFDWTIIDRLEFVAEQAAFTSKSFWFNNIAVSNLDTAKVYENGTVGISSISSSSGNLQLRGYPNPFATDLTVDYNIPETGNVEIELLNSIGTKVATLIHKDHTMGYYSTRINMSQFGLFEGLYFCRLKTNSGVQTIKLIKR